MQMHGYYALNKQNIVILLYWQFDVKASPRQFHKTIALTTWQEIKYNGLFRDTNSAESEISVAITMPL